MEAGAARGAAGGYPVDVLEDDPSGYREAALAYYAELRAGTQLEAEVFSLPTGEQVRLEAPSVCFCTVHRDEPQHKILVLVSPRDTKTVVALYLKGSWWATEDALRTSDPAREGLVKVQSFGERVVLFILNVVIFGRLERRLDDDDMFFLPHSGREEAKVLWRDGAAVGFYTTKAKGSLCGDGTGACYLLPVFDTVFVRRGHRCQGLGMAMLRDFCQTFREDSALGVSWPISPAMYQVCRKFLSAHPEERGRLWEVEPPGAWGQRHSIWLQVQLRQPRLPDGELAQLSQGMRRRPGAVRGGRLRMAEPDSPATGRAARRGSVAKSRRTQRRIRTLRWEKPQQSCPGDAAGRSWTGRGPRGRHWPGWPRGQQKCVLVPLLTPRGPPCGTGHVDLYDLELPSVLAVSSSVTLRCEYLFPSSDSRSPAVSLIWGPLLRTHLDACTGTAQTCLSSAQEAPGRAAPGQSAQERSLKGAVQPQEPRDCRCPGTPGRYIPSLEKLPEGGAGLPGAHLWPLAEAVWPQRALQAGHRVPSVTSAEGELLGEFGLTTLVAFGVRPVTELDVTWPALPQTLPTGLPQPRACSPLGIQSGAKDCAPQALILIPSSVCLSIHPPVLHPSVRPSIHLFIHLLSICPSVIQPATHSPTHPSMHSSICLHVSVCPSVHPVVEQTFRVWCGSAR